MFICDKCGMCCKNVGGSSVYKELDDGTGKCRYLVKNICSIYEDRPLLCRVDESYEVFFKDKMTLEEYYRLNYEVCNKLKSGGL